jgi:multicomponent Na+:H+ antiporter subunit G
MSISSVISAVLIVAGCALGLLGGVGIYRFPDVLGRMHAATKPPTLGLVLVAVAAILRVDELAGATLLVLVILLQFLTAPVGAHMVARAAYESGDQLDDATVIDDLSQADPPEQFPLSLAIARAESAQLLQLGRQPIGWSQRCDHAAPLGGGRSQWLFRPQIRAC